MNRRLKVAIAATATLGLGAAGAATTVGAATAGKNEILTSWAAPRSSQASS